MRLLILVAICYLITAVLLTSLAFGNPGHGNPTFHVHSRDIDAWLIWVAVAVGFVVLRFIDRR